MKNLFKLFAVSALALSFVGCSSSDQAPNDSDHKEAEKHESVKDFDGSAFSDTGEGIMYLATPGGTSENGAIPEVALTPDILTTIDVCTEGMDGSVVTVYLDGMEKGKINASEMSQNQIEISGNDVLEGDHTVEIVKMDGDTPVIYKRAQYKAVN